MPELRQNTAHNHCTVVSKFVSHKGRAGDSETMYVSMSAEQMSRYDVDDEPGFSQLERKSYS